MAALLYDWKKLRIGATLSIKAKTDEKAKKVRSVLISSSYAFRRIHNKKFKITTTRTKTGITAKRVK
jgi:hypothetical protein